MSESEKLVVGLLLFLVLFLAPGYVLHVSPRFAGSLTGGILGIAAATLMVFLLVYPMAKYMPWMKRRFTGGPLRTVLAFHVYGGAVAALLGILHSGHKYESPLGIALVLSMLTVVVSGFIGRYYLAPLADDLRHQQGSLSKLRSIYNSAAAALAGREGSQRSFASSGVSILPLVESIADLEYAIAGRQALKRTLNLWIVIHVLAAMLFYALLALHIWSGIYYGLRWLP